MSKETSEWLNQNVLIGFTDKRGHAWHYKASDQGSEPNHYPGAIPVGDVLRRLFSWRPERLDMFVKIGGEFVMVPGRTVIARDDTHEVFGAFKESYCEHDYQEWLLGNVANILKTGEIEVGSAGLLQNGAQAWVQVEVPETQATKEGVAFRPFLLASTSLNGTLATGYRTGVQLVVCDNTLAAAHAESDKGGTVYKIRHSKHSHLRLEDAAAALEIVDQIGGDFEAEVAELCEWTITDAQFDALLSELVPMPTDGNKRGTTVATTKREQISTLYNFDTRAATWKGTAFGALQAFNTYQHHLRGTRGDTQVVERNMADVLTGTMAKGDSAVLDTLALVCSN